MPGPQSKYKIQWDITQHLQMVQLSLRYMAPYAQVQRARMLRLAYQHPDWNNAQLAKEIGC
ncbi:MAG: hypothetical protein L0Y56_09425 [Nitrospira sp.]|nr:hypothetical protein [Nitrospira sp.]